MKNFLQEGDVIELTTDHKVYAEVPCHFVFDNAKGDFSLTKHGVKLSGDFEYLQGKYIVVKTAMTGGGTGHGIHDVFPDGHEVTCKREDGKYTVSFYQSGCFTAMIREIEPIAKATLQWKITG